MAFIKAVREMFLCCTVEAYSVIFVPGSFDYTVQCLKTTYVRSIEIYTLKIDKLDFLIHLVNLHLDLFCPYFDTFSEMVLGTITAIPFCVYRLRKLAQQFYLFHQTQQWLQSGWLAGTPHRHT